MTWLLCDYGEVLCTAQPPEDREKLVAVAGVDSGTFWERYWHHRPPYDRGDVSATEYWASVLQTSPGEDQVQALVALDVASWSHPNHAAVAAAREAGRRGYRLAILSNAPPEVSAAVDAADWLADFHPRIFSCRLRMVKPEPGVFRQTAEILGARPEEIIYFDDKPDNVAAAAALGMQAHRFVDAVPIEKLPSLE